MAKRNGPLLSTSTPAGGVLQHEISRPISSDAGPHHEIDWYIPYEYEYDTTRSDKTTHTLCRFSEPNFPREKERRKHKTKTEISSRYFHRPIARHLPSLAIVDKASLEICRTGVCYPITTVVSSCVLHGIQIRHQEYA